MSRLERIVAAKRIEVAERRARGVTKRQRPRPVVDAHAALRRAENARLSLIAEIKFKSPSAGPLSRAMGPAARAIAYEKAGAKMVSVLTDGSFFDGSHLHLAEVATALEATPVLAKEFVIDDAQIDEAYVHGADAVLVIARIVDDATLARLIRACELVSMHALVEVFTDEELTRAITAGAKIIGVNARDLDTLEMNAERARAILERIPKEKIAIHLSGIKTPEHVRAIAETRADAALIGEVLMREDDPTTVLSSLVAAT